MAEKAKKVARAAKANPVTATGSVGIVVSIVGRWLGWDAQLQADVATLFLIAVPAVRGFVAWWDNRKAGEEEVSEESDA